ncbi:hypothetical protein ACWEQU_26025 [Streptomyces nodosus]
MTDHVPAAIPAPVFEEQHMPVLVGDPMRAGRFTTGGADVLLGPAGTLIITEADDEPARSGVWNAEEFHLIGPAPAPVTERLLEPPWGADRSSLPIHIAVRAGADVLYLGTAWVSQAGTTNGVLTDCELRFDTPLARELLDRVRPPRPPEDMPGLAWLAQVNGDRAAALEQFITGGLHLLTWRRAMQASCRPPTCCPVFPMVPRLFWHVYGTSFSRLRTTGNCLGWPRTVQASLRGRQVRRADAHLRSAASDGGSPEAQLRTPARSSTYPRTGRWQ